jgi:ketosteroid isomerase-like protein
MCVQVDRLRTQAKCYSTKVTKLESESKGQIEMNRLLLYTLGISLILFGAITAFAQTKKAPPAKPAADAEFTALIKRYYELWNTANADNPAPLYAKDADLVFYDIIPLKYTGWTEYRDGVKKNFFDNMSSGTLTPADDLKVERRGTIAWTTVTFHLSVKMKDGRKIEADCRHTAIWERKAGKWLIVHEHVSAPLPA